jgi:hypothetical protein
MQLLPYDCLPIICIFKNHVTSVSLFHLTTTRRQKAAEGLLGACARICYRGLVSINCRQHYLVALPKLFAGVMSQKLRSPGDLLTGVSRPQNHSSTKPYANHNDG